MTAGDGLPRWRELAQGGNAAEDPVAMTRTWYEAFAATYTAHTLPRQQFAWDKALEVLVRFGRVDCAADQLGYPRRSPLSTGLLLLGSKESFIEGQPVPALRIALPGRVDARVHVPQLRIAAGRRTGRGLGSAARALNSQTIITGFSVRTLTIARNPAALQSKDAVWYAEAPFRPWMPAQNYFQEEADMGQALKKRADVRVAVQPLGAFANNSYRGWLPRPAVPSLGLDMDAHPRPTAPQCEAARSDCQDRADIVTAVVREVADMLTVPDLVPVRSLGAAAVQNL
jgi:hypothetical protein